jgi:hypothetical protein
VLGASVVAVLAAASPAQAQARLDARYVATLGGLPIGKGTWVIDLAEDQFTAAASGATTGLLQVFSGGSGSGASRGYLVGGKPAPATFASSVTSSRKTEEIRITIMGGNVKDYAVTPPVISSPDRVPLTDAHRVAVNDPMTAALIRVPGSGDPVRAEACPRSIAVFDGRLRFDLRLTFKRFERVKAERGYEGPVVVCAVQFVPLAGYVPTRATIRYLIERRDMEMWLAPIGSTRVVVPYRIVIPTPLGLGVLEAIQFVAAPQKPRAAASGSKTQ